MDLRRASCCSTDLGFSRDLESLVAVVKQMDEQRGVEMKMVYLAEGVQVDVPLN